MYSLVFYFFSVTFMSHVICITLVGCSSTVFGFFIHRLFICYNCKYFDTNVYNSRDIKIDSDSLHCVNVFFQKMWENMGNNDISH